MSFNPSRRALRYLEFNKLASAVSFPLSTPRLFLPASFTSSSANNNVTQPRQITTRSTMGDLNNTSAMRQTVFLEPDPAYFLKSLAILDAEDDAEIRRLYRLFLLPSEIARGDWIAKLELSTALGMVDQRLQSGEDRVKALVLYGSLRKRSYSRLLAYEACRILFRLGCDVRVFDPSGLPVKDDVQHDHPKVQELRELSKWSDGHVWICPEQHGTLTGVFKNQIDWVPLSTGSVRPTQGRTLAIAQVSGGSQSFNTVNSLRILGRWMRMFTIPNQSSIPKAYTQFTAEDDEEDGGSRLMPSDNRDRLVDCMEEFVKYSIVMRPHFNLFGDRFSERSERIAKDKRQQQAKQPLVKAERQALQTSPVGINKEVLLDEKSAVNGITRASVAV